MASGKYRFEVVFSNAKAVTALAEAIALVVDAREDLPWREDLGEAVEHLRYAAEHLNLRHIR